VKRDERFRSASACLGALFVSVGRPELVPADLLRAGARSEAPPASTAERMLEALQEAATALWRWPGRD
jgi:hypothetical protein